MAKQSPRRVSKLISRGATAIDVSGQRVWFLDTDGFVYLLQPEEYKTKVACPIREGGVVCVLIAEANRSMVGVVEFSQEIIDAEHSDVEV